MKKRLLSLGDIPDSNGGLYNPGVLKFGNERMIVVRHEKDYNFTNEVKCTMFIGTLEDFEKKTYQFYELKKEGFPESRIEDFRLFKYKDQIYASHTLCIPNGISPKLVKPVISRINRQEIRLWDMAELPKTKGGFEKNWLFYEHKRNLFCFYLIDPLTIYQLKGWSWSIVKQEDIGLHDMIKELLPGCGFLSLSAIEKIEDKFIGFCHVIHEGFYKQIPFLFNPDTLEIEGVGDVMFKGGNEEGIKPAAMYISSLVLDGGSLEIYYGSGDSHTEVIIEPIEKILKAIKPFKKKKNPKVLFKDLGIGDFICAMYAIQGWLNENPESYVKLYLTRNMELGSVLRIQRVKMYVWNGEDVDFDLSSNDNKAEYKEKIKGSFKEWYAKKLNTKPAKINVDHITPHPEYKDIIVLAPFAAWAERSWNIKNWELLAELLQQHGEKIVIVDEFENRCRTIPGEKVCGRSLYEVSRLLKSSKLVISNESGIAHLAGALGVKCLVLSGWLDPRKVYDMTNNDYIYQIPLQSISVEQIMDYYAGIKKV